MPKAKNTVFMVSVITASKLVAVTAGYHSFSEIVSLHEGTIIQGRFSADGNFTSYRAMMPSGASVDKLGILAVPERGVLA